jgi:hypothetical protein
MEPLDSSCSMMTWCWFMLKILDIAYYEIVLPTETEASSIDQRLRYCLLVVASK